MTNTQQPVPSNSDYSGLEIAVIGMAGRFPGAQSVDKFWQNLQRSVESIVSIEDESLLAQGVSAETLADPDYVKAGGVLEDVDLFDAAFFGFSPREAEILDPQQRLFLETAVEALETAGYDAEQYPGQIGVYGGAGMNGYLLNLYGNSTTRESVSPYELFISNDKDFLTTRVSYQLNLTGPSVDVQTACSSSLVAVHMACQALLSGECDMALAGGVAISKQLGYRAQAGSIYSPDGHCRAFDAAAAGTVSGNGVGIVVLKRLEDAIAQKDTVDAVIKGSAINNDGALKVSYTAPCVEAQSAVIRAAQTMAEIPASSVSYVEAHGTGTALGDPIEISALTQAFSDEESQYQKTQIHNQQTCAIGSVKTNIGHLDAASGIVSLIKTVLALKHKQIPASLHFQHPNSNIDFDNCPFYVNTTLSEWPQGETKRRAGVSSFGIGGTNAHIVLEEAPASVTVEKQSENKPKVEPKNQPKVEQSQLLVVSAKTPAALDIASLNLAEHLSQQVAAATPSLSLADVAYTLQVGRKAFDYRRSVVCRNFLEATERLRVQDARKIFEQPETVFLFSGQGSQHVNMAKGLYETQPVFRQALDRCSAILNDEGIDLLPLMYAALATECASTLQQTAYAQPMLFAVEYALSQLWISWNVKPTAMLGHSIGEYVAACIAGVFELKTALKLVCLRGKLMQQMPTGAMLSVALSEQELNRWLGKEANKEVSEDVTVAVNNAPSLCVLSGSKEAIASTRARLESENISCHRLHTSHAFHSPMMEGVIAPFIAAVSQAVNEGKLHSPTVPFVSNLTGTWITAEEATSPDYWARHLRQTVRFSEGMDTLMQLSNPVFLEVGPSDTLTKLAQQHCLDKSQSLLFAVNSLPHPKSAEPDTTVLLSAVGKLWSAGIEIDWQAVHGKHSYRRIPLPTYPFERQRYWVDMKGTALAVQTKVQKSVQKTTELAASLEDWFYTPSWERHLPIFRAADSSVAGSAERPCWLVFLDSGGVGKQLAKKIEKLGRDVFTVCMGDEFEQSGYRQFSLNPGQPKAFNQLFEDLRLREMMPTEIVYLWSLEFVELPEQPSERSDNFAVLMNLFQALSSTVSTEAAAQPIQTVVVTEGAHEVVGSEALNPKASQLQGLCQVVGQEYPAVGCRQIDWVKGGKTSKQIAQILWQEMQVESPAAVVAYRDGKGQANWGRYRWKQTYQPVRLPGGIKTTDAKGIHLQKGGLYVIVGEQGLGNVWCDRLQEHYQANVVCIKAMSSAEALLSQLKQSMETFSTRIRGVFVSSPMTNARSAAPITLLQTSHWQYNCQTKREVLENLAIALQDSAFQDAKPDFCCVQSSLSSIIGGVGLAAYAGANHFIDSFVAHQNQQSPSPWFSINWDAHTESEENDSKKALSASKNSSENIASQSAQPAWGAAISDFALTPDEVWQATERILTQAIPGQIIVSKGDLRSRYQKWIHAVPQTVTPNAAAKNYEGKSYSRPQISTAYVAPRDDMEEKIAAIWQDLLGLEKVGVDDSFFDLGGHSLIAIQVISRLREAFPVAIEMRNLLFEAPTVAKIADAIRQQLPPEQEIDEMAALLAEVQALSTEEVQAQLAGGEK